MGGKLEIDNFLPLQCLADRSCLLLTFVCRCSRALPQRPRGRDGHSGKCHCGADARASGQQSPGWGGVEGGAGPAHLNGAHHRLGLQAPRPGHEFWFLHALAV